MDRAGTFNGLFGKREVSKMDLEANASFGNYGLATSNRNFAIPKYPMDAKVFFPQTVDYSTRTEVLPCFSQNKFNLRNPPQFDNTHGLQPLTGIGAKQKKGFVNERATTTPYLKPRSNVVATMNTNISIPA
jgi:hypothetical protein